jgi:hypothetical protein
VEEDLAAIFGFDIGQDFSEKTGEDGPERTEKPNVSGRWVKSLRRMFVYNLHTSYEPTLSIPYIFMSPL